FLYLTLSAPPRIHTPSLHDALPISICAWGRRQLRAMAGQPALCIAVSDYNKQDLREAGFTCPIEVCPILIPFEDYDKTPNQAVLDRKSTRLNSSHVSTSYAVFCLKK